MKNLDKISAELFNKIRGRFPSVTIGDEEGNITNVPEVSRFFDFEYKADGKKLGNVSISIDEDKGITVLYSNDIVANESTATRNNWYNFLKELRAFSRKRLLNFNTRDITKSNLNKRDYKFLATNRTGDDNMNESKLYGTSRWSYQDFDGARLAIKHTESVNQELPTGRTQKVGSIFVDNTQGERFKYPFKHIAGARAMARHVAEGGNPHDDFGKHIVSLSEELSKLRKFKNYMGRNSVMAESLSEYMDVIKDRVATVKKTIESLQKKSFYQEAVESFEAPVFEEVPADVAENWIDELTIRQFNEELKDVFPYIYKLVSENTKARELGPLDLEGYSVYEGEGDTCSCCGNKITKDGCGCDDDCPHCGGKGKVEEAGCKSSHKKKKTKEELALEQGFEAMMGQFNEAQDDCPCCNGGRDKCSHGKEVCGTCEGTGKVAKESAPYGEPSQQAQAKMDMEAAYEKGGEEALAKEMGLSPEELDQEINDCARENGLHPDDDRDECIGMVIDDTIDNADWDTHEGIGEGAGEYSYTLEYNGEQNGYAKHKLIITSPEGKTKLVADDFTYFDTDDEEELQAELESWFKYGHGIGDEQEESKKDHDNDGDIDSDDYLKAKDIAIKKAMAKQGKKNDAADHDDKPLKEKVPLGEFILSFFDKETGEFPKGETAVLTMVEKDYGDKFIEPAKQFIEKIYQTCEEFEMAQNPQQIETDTEFDRMRELAGIR